MDPFALPVARLSCADVTTRLFAGQTLRIGRASDNQLIIDDPKVSRSHAQLEWNGAGYSLRDLGSVNGTFVNGERLTGAPRLLRDGDEISIHIHKLHYFIERAEPVLLPHEMGRVDTVSGAAGGARLLVIHGPDDGQEYPLWGEQVTLGRAARSTRRRSLPTQTLGIPVSGGPGSEDDPSTLQTDPALTRLELPVTWEIRLNDPSVSRPHARFERRQGCYYLSDLRSANGTLLNGRPVGEAAALTDGDLIVVGSTHLRFYDAVRKP